MSGKFIFVVLIVTLAVFINQSYSLPNDSEAEINEFKLAKIVKRGLFDCPHNCWGNVGKFNHIKILLLSFNDNAVIL